MRSKPLIFAFGLVTGMVLMWAITPTQQSLPPPSVDDSKKVQREVRLALAQVADRMRQLETRDANLKAELEELRAAARTNVPPPARATEGGPDTNRPAGMTGMIGAAMRQQADMELSAMKLRLHLTDQQEQSIRRILERQFGAAGDTAEKMLEGRMSREDLDTQSASTNSAKSQIKQLLTPEQQVEYDKYQIEQRQTQAQMAANVELSQVQPLLQLTEQQQEQVFQILYQQAEANFDKTDGGTRIAVDWEKQIQAKKEALRPVLTAEQFQGYEKLLDSQREMIKAFMPKTEQARPMSPP